MPIWTVLMIAVALSMDAFAVALACGVIQKPFGARRTFRLGWHFGLFQALMPIIGWSAGSLFQRFIESSDHWVAFAFLAFVGMRMIIESVRGEKDGEAKKDPTKGWSLVMLSVATSIDAMAVGLSLAMLKVSIWFPALVIGIVTAAITSIGCQSGFFLKADSRAGRYAEAAGGLVLVGIGVKILATHLNLV